MSNGTDRTADAEQFAKAAQADADATHAKEEALRIFAKKGFGADAARIIVTGENEDFHVEDPELIRGRYQDVVIWFCENNTANDITVQLLDFRLRFGAEKKAGSPVKFATRNRKKIASGKTALIHGKVNRDPKVIEFFKYTVRVKGAAKTHDHDPDLEIKP